MKVLRKLASSGPIAQAHASYIVAQAAVPCKEYLQEFKLGDCVAFRHEDICRWPRELMFGTVINTCPRNGSNNTQYLRVLWIRGVVQLENMTFQSSLVMHNAWPIPINEYISLYHAFRCVVISECIARKFWRREKFAGRLNTSTESMDFPDSDNLLNEIVEKIKHSLQEMQIEKDQLSTRDLLMKVQSGDRNWVDDKAEELIDVIEKEALYQPTERVRILLLDIKEVMNLKAIRRQTLTHVIKHMMDTYTGFGWDCWIDLLNEVSEIKKLLAIFFIFNIIRKGAQKRFIT